MDSLDADEKGRVTLWLVFSSFVASIAGSFQFGYQVGMLTGPSTIMQGFYNQSQLDRRDEYLSDTASLWLWSTTISIFCIGGAMGALTGGYMADVLGRKGAMLLTNCFAILGGLLMGLSYVANNYEMVIIGRFVIGYYAGVGITIVPIYLVEISPVNLRGAIGTIHQLMLTIGILVAQALGIYAFNSETGWPILVGLSAAPSVLQLFVLPFCPESPRWYYIMKNEEDKCRKALVILRGTDSVDTEMAEIKQEAEESRQQSESDISVLDVLRVKEPEWKKPLIISVFIHLGQQFSGVNALLFYATEIYEDSGLSEDQIGLATVGVGGINVIMTVIAVFVVDRAGRRPLLLYPFAIITIATAILTLSLKLQETTDGWKWVSLLMIYIFIIAFAIGPAPLPFVLVPEIWAQGPRPAAMSISVQVNWYCNFLVGLTFPYLQATMGPFAFLIFGAFSLMTTIFIFFFIPETKGRTFEDIVAGFRGQPLTQENEEGYNKNIYVTDGTVNQAFEGN